MTFPPPDGTCALGCGNGDDGVCEITWRGGGVGEGSVREVCLAVARCPAMNEAVRATVECFRALRVGECSFGKDHGRNCDEYGHTLCCPPCVRSRRRQQQRR